MMKQTATVLTFFAVLLLAASCAKKETGPPPTATSLIGLTRAELVAQFGEPDDARQSAPGVEGLLFDDGGIYLDVSVQDGQVVNVIVPMASSLKLDTGIGYASSLVEVTRIYGDFGSTQDIQGDMKGSDYSAGTLYHDTKTDKYKLRYDEPPLLFYFDANKKVHVFSVGRHM